MAKKDTKGRILGAAVRLFNERGTAAVSTNHIAQEAGISPGNLYYHFRSKEEIIRAIFERVDAHWKDSYALPQHREPVLEDVRAMAEQTLFGIWEYRFFYRELGALTRRDPELARRFRQLRERGVVGTEALLRSFLCSGVLVGPQDEVVISRLAKALMLAAEFWLPFEETGSEVQEPETLQEGVALMMLLLEPYLADEEPSDVAHTESGSAVGGTEGGGVR